MTHCGLHFLLFFMYQVYPYHVTYIYIYRESHNTTHITNMIHIHNRKFSTCAWLFN